MDEKNESNNIKKECNELKENINNNLIKGNENNEFNINKDEIQIYSPEELQNLLVQEEPNNNINIEKTKNIKNKGILNFDDFKEMKRKKDKSNMSNTSNNRHNNIKNKSKKEIKIKINFNGKLYQPKKNYNITEIPNKKENNNKIRKVIKNKIIIKKNKSSKSYEPLEKREKIDNKKIIIEFLMRNYQNKNKEKANNSQNYNIEMINNKKRKNNKINNIKSSRSQKNNNKINYDNLRYLKTTQSFENKKNRNQSSSKSKDEDISKAKKKSKGLRIINIPNNIVESEINSALKNKIRNIPKNYSPIKNKLINFDNSKYEKINNEQMKYNIIKEYSNIKPNKEKGFLNRMQFYSLKRKKRQENINKLIEKNKYKLSESEKDITFNRLITDANRRITQKNMLDKEKIKKEFYNQIYIKKYNDEEWNKIYDQRFRSYSEYKDKKLEIKKEKEKIEKLISELQSKKNDKNINIIQNNNSKLNENIKIQEIKKKYKINSEQNYIFEFYNKSENNVNCENNYNFFDNKNKHDVIKIMNYENFKKMKKEKLNNYFAQIKKIPIDNKKRKKKCFDEANNIKYIKFIKSNNSNKNNLLMKNSYSTNFINRFNNCQNKQNNKNNIKYNDDGQIQKEGNIVDKYLLNYCLKYNYLL